jgi:hypothetical protein
VLIASIATTTILITGIALTATGNTRNIKVPYYIYCYKSYHTKEKCWILYPHLKQQAKAEKGYHRLSNKKRKTHEDNNKLDNPVGLITHFRITANSNTDNLLHTQWAINTGCSHHITHLQEHFISYKTIPKSSAHVRGLGGISYTPIGRGTVKL